MSAFIETLTFTSVAAVTYDFNDGSNDVQIWLPTLAPRGQSNPRMQMHGTNPRSTLLGQLSIDHEGLFGPAASQEDVIAERDALNAALFGDLSAPPPGAGKIGTLTVKYLGWTETATGPVSIDSYSAGFAASDILTLAYSISWRCDLPYFIGDTSGDPVLL